MYTCYCHVFVNEEQKDYYVMYAHHVVTIGLVLGESKGTAGGGRIVLRPETKSMSS